MLGPDGLDEVAINSVKNWTFSPAYYDGNPVTSWVTFSINFAFE